MLRQNIYLKPILLLVLYQLSPDPPKLCMPLLMYSHCYYFGPFPGPPIRKKPKVLNQNRKSTFRFRNIDNDSTIYIKRLLHASDRSTMHSLCVDEQSEFLSPSLTLVRFDHIVISTTIQFTFAKRRISPPTALRSFWTQTTSAQLLTVYADSRPRVNTWLAYI